MDCLNKRLGSEGMKCGTDPQLMAMIVGPHTGAWCHDRHSAHLAFCNRDIIVAIERRFRLLWSILECSWCNEARRGLPGNIAKLPELTEKSWASSVNQFFSMKHCKGC